MDVQVIEITPTMPPTQQAKEPVEFPEWLQKMVSRQDQLNRRYAMAHAEVARAYNEFLLAIEEVNEQTGTEFTFQQIADEYKGEFAFDAASDDDEDDDED